MQAILNQTSSNSNHNNNTPANLNYDQSHLRRHAHLQGPQIMNQQQQAIRIQEREIKAQAGLKDVSTEAYLEF